MRDLVIEYLNSECFSDNYIAGLDDEAIESISRTMSFCLWSIYKKTINLLKLNN